MTARVKYAIDESVYQPDVDDVSTRDSYVTITLDPSTSTEDGAVVHGICETVKYSTAYPTETHLVDQEDGADVTC